MSSEASAVGANFKRNAFLNFWNLGQAFYFSGRSTINAFKKFMDVVKRRNPHIKILNDIK